MQGTWQPWMERPLWWMAVPGAPCCATSGGCVLGEGNGLQLQKGLGCLTWMSDPSSLDWGVGDSGPAPQVALVPLSSLQPAASPLARGCA